MGFNSYRRMTVAELRNILAQAIEILDDYPDDTKIIERANTYGCPTPYLSTPNGFYPLNDLEFEDMEESINEKRGFLRKYRGCSIHDMGDVYVVTNENGLNIGEEKTELGAEAIIDTYLDKKIEKKGFTVTEEKENFETIFNNIFPFASINDEFARDTMFKIGKVVYKYLSKDCVGDCFFLLQSILKKLLKIIFGRPGDRRVEVMYDTIDNYIMSKFDDEDLGTRCVRDILTILEE